MTILDRFTFSIIASSTLEEYIEAVYYDNQFSDYCHNVKQHHHLSDSKYITIDTESNGNIIIEFSESLTFQFVGGINK